MNVNCQCQYMNIRFFPHQVELCHHYYDLISQEMMYMGIDASE